jgi:hypothetical protein
MPEANRCLRPFEQNQIEQKPNRANPTVLTHSEETRRMPMENFSRYQQSVIKNFYKNRDAVSLQRAQELLTELYLAEGKKLEKAWDSMFTNLERIPELIAKLIEKML